MQMEDIIIERLVCFQPLVEACLAVLNQEHRKKNTSRYIPTIPNDMRHILLVCQTLIQLSVF